MMKIPDNITSENHRFFVITQIAYIVGLTAHLALGILFQFLDVQEMAWFNFFISEPIFSAALVLNRSAFLNLAFGLAISELYFHQVAAVYFLGWESGLQYFLIYLAALPFFNARWSLRLRFVFILFICVIYVILFTYFKVPDAIRLAPFIYYMLYMSSAIATLLLLVVIINYFVRSTDRAETELKQANRNLSKKNDQIQETLKQRDNALATLGR
jgi:sigma-B regulation protein RsbU (phosphoserine phosphatase)